MVFYNKYQKLISLTECRYSSPLYLQDKYKKADLDSGQKKNYLIEYKHGVAVSDSSELPISGCCK